MNTTNKTLKSSPGKEVFPPWGKLKGGSQEGALTSKYFTLRELTRSAAALKHKLDNTPDAAAVARLQALVTHVLDPLRQLYGAPIMVTSGYRSPAVNAAVGGAAHSQHLLGEAADITTGSPEGNRRLLGIALAHAQDLHFDQLIAE